MGFPLPSASQESTENWKGKHTSEFRESTVKPAKQVFANNSCWKGTGSRYWWYEGKHAPEPVVRDLEREKNTFAPESRYLIHVSLLWVVLLHKSCIIIRKMQTTVSADDNEMYVQGEITSVASVCHTRLDRWNNGCLCFARNNMHYQYTSGFISYCQKIIFRFK